MNFSTSHNLFLPIHKAITIKSLTIQFPDYDISACGHQFLNFTKLKHLFIQSEVFKFDMLPEEIGQLHTLKRLEILNFNYTSFPKWILKLENLEHLLLRGNDITQIPIEIIRLKKLKTLRIENCKLQYLSATFHQFNSLTKLSLVDNFHLQDIDPNHLPKGLTSLKLNPSNLAPEVITEINATIFDTNKSLKDKVLKQIRNLRLRKRSIS